MSKITEAIVYTINGILANAGPNMPKSTPEVTQAVYYIQHLLEIHDKNFDALEAALIRFFRVRPKMLNESTSPISTLYKLLMVVKIIPESDARQTAEEKLLSEFIHFFFTPPAKNVRQGDYEALPHVDLSSDAVLFYDIVCHVKPGIKDLHPTHGAFDWNRRSLLTGTTLVHEAIGKNDSKLLALLIAAGADLNAKSKIHGTPLEYVLSMTFKDADFAASILMLLKDCPMDASPEHLNMALNIILNVIHREKYIKTTEALLTMKALDLLNYKDKDGHTLFYHAAAARLPTLTETLIKLGANVNQRGSSDESPLEYSMRRRSNEVTLALLKSPAIDIHTPFFQKHTNILFYAVCKDECDVNVHILCASMYFYDLDVFKSILSKEEGLKLVNSTDQNGHTPLHRAIALGNLDYAGALIQNGAQINAKCQRGNTPLSLLAKSKTVEGRPIVNADVMANMLIKQMTPSMINEKTENGMTALGWAVVTDNRSVVAVLLNSQGIDLSERFDGKSIAEVAAERWSDVTVILEALQMRTKRDKENATITLLQQRVDAMSNELCMLQEKVATLEGLLAAQAAPTAHTRFWSSPSASALIELSTHNSLSLSEHRRG